ncbi:DNRLRE domain-containing protein [Nonomuraea sp. NPDC050328]|uniref:DNRLRE domain-containing protein n=1 Tax=Nonomuraea sp. NPDC050328 TaxID=3364361 RepID=UPI003799D71A
MLVTVTLASVTTAQQLPAAASPNPVPALFTQKPPPAGEILGASTENRRVTRTPEGRLVIETWTQPVRVRRDNAWQWIDPTLVESAGTLRPKITATDVAFSAGGARQPLATLNVPDRGQIIFSWPDPLGKPTVTGNKAAYPDAAGPGSSLVVTALATGFRWEIVLNSRPAKTDFTFPLQAPGLTVKPGTNGAATVLDPGGREIARSTPVALRSANGKQRVISASATAKALSVRPESAFLADPQTTYPVAIGATVGTAATRDVDITDEGNPANPGSSTLTAGGIFGIRNRSYLRFDDTALTGQNIVDAKLTLTNTDGPGCGETVNGIQVRRVTGRWDASTITWNTAPASTTEGAQTIKQSYGPDCDMGPLDWPITDIAKSWAAGEPNYGVVLQAPDETLDDDDFRVLASSEYGMPNLTPKITVTAVPAPRPTVVSPAGPDGVEVFTAPAAWKLDTLPVSSVNTHALSGASDRAQANAPLLAPPYFDPETGQVVAPATTAGKDLAGQALSGIAYANGEADETIPGDFENEDSPAAHALPLAPLETNYSVAPHVVEVANSYQKLDSILDEVLDLDETVPAGTELFATHLWPERNLVVVQSTDASPGLRKALADRYGTYSVAIWLRTDADRLDLIDDQQSQSAATDNRQVDTGKVNGGSLFASPATGDGRECTTGFAMGSAADKLMVSAGHCTAGANQMTSIGTVKWDNHTDGVGTVKLPGQPTYYGDLTLINTLFRETSPTIFVGDQNSSLKRWVGGRYSVPAKEGDQYCTGGITSGQICRWKVTDLGWKIENKESGAKTRWLQMGKKAGRCVNGGDSGGPVYTFRSDGYVVAKGITAVSNAKTEPILDVCVHGFTDFHDVMKAVGKDIYKK